MATDEGLSSKIWIIIASRKLIQKIVLKNNLAIIVSLLVHGECSSLVTCATHTWFYFFVCFLTFFPGCSRATKGTVNGSK